jgi:hypothetical protein
MLGFFESILRHHNFLHTQCCFARSKYNYSYIFLIIFQMQV